MSSLSRRLAIVITPFQKKERVDDVLHFMFPYNCNAQDIFKVKDNIHGKSQYITIIVRQKLISLPFFTVKVEFAITVVQIAFSNTGEQNKASLVTPLFIC